MKQFTTLVVSISCTLALLVTIILLLVSGSASTAHSPSEKSKLRSLEDVKLLHLSFGDSVTKQTTNAQKQPLPLIANKTTEIPSSKNFTNTDSRRRAGRQYLGADPYSGSSMSNDQLTGGDGSSGGQVEQVDSQTSQELQSNTASSVANDASTFHSFGEQGPIGQHVQHVPQQFSISAAQYAQATAGSNDQTSARQAALAQNYDYSNHGQAANTGGDFHLLGYPSTARTDRYQSSISDANNNHYANTNNNNHNHYQQHYHDQVGYNVGQVGSTKGGDRSISDYDSRHSPVSSVWPSAAASSGNPLSFGGSFASGLSHWTKGFSVGELICGLVAIAVAAVVLGAPFFLIYLMLMGNISTTGTLSLTNPLQVPGTTQGGNSLPMNNQNQQQNTNNASQNGRRRKRSINSIFDEANLKTKLLPKDKSSSQMRNKVFANSLNEQIELLSPLSSQNIESMISLLLSSIEKYSKV